MDNLSNHKRASVLERIEAAGAILPPPPQPFQRCFASPEPWAAPPDSPNLKAKYQQLIAGGKPPKATITTVMQNLIVTANALLKADLLWIKYLTITDTLRSAREM